MLTLKMYNKLALLTGFPQYTNSVDTPDITRTLLEYLSQGLNSVIDNLYIQNNVLERFDTITVKKGQDEVGVEGIIKSVQIINKGETFDVPYMDNFNQDTFLTDEERAKHSGTPKGYTIRKGYMRLFPIPDEEYTLKVVVSTTNLVWANNDVSRNTIEDIEDSVMADSKFCDLVVLKAATLLLARANNGAAQILANVYKERFDNYLEHDLKTTQGNRFFDRSAGHFDIDRGLLG